jgi:hypothetical protein
VLFRLVLKPENLLVENILVGLYHLFFLHRQADLVEAVSNAHFSNVYCVIICFDLVILQKYIAMGTDLFFEERFSLWLHNSVHRPLVEDGEVYLLLNDPARNLDVVDVRVYLWIIIALWCLAFFVFALSDLE